MSKQDLERRPPIETEDTEQETDFADSEIGGRLFNCLEAPKRHRLQDIWNDAGEDENIQEKIIAYVSEWVFHKLNTYQTVEKLGEELDRVKIILAACEEEMCDEIALALQSGIKRAVVTLLQQGSLEHVLEIVNQLESVSLENLWDKEDATLQTRVQQGFIQGFDKACTSLLEELLPSWQERFLELCEIPRSLEIPIDPAIYPTIRKVILEMLITSEDPWTDIHATLYHFMTKDTLQKLNGLRKKNGTEADYERAHRTAVEQTAIQLEIRDNQTLRKAAVSLLSQTIPLLTSEIIPLQRKAESTSTWLEVIFHFTDGERMEAATIAKNMRTADATLGEALEKSPDGETDPDLDLDLDLDPNLN